MPSNDSTHISPLNWSSPSGKLWGSNLAPTKLWSSGCCRRVCQRGDGRQGPQVRCLALPWKKTSQEAFKSPILLCSAPVLSARDGCELQHWHGAMPWVCRADQCITMEARKMHILIWKTTTASFIVIISALRHRHYCLSSNLPHFSDYQRTVRSSSFLWKATCN